VLAIYIIGATVVALNRVRTGWTLLAVAAVLTAWGHPLSDLPTGEQ